MFEFKIDINRDRNEVLKEIINGFDKNITMDLSDLCTLTKPYIFNDFISANE